MTLTEYVSFPVYVAVVQLKVNSDPELLLDVKLMIFFYSNVVTGVIQF